MRLRHSIWNVCIRKKTEGLIVEDPEKPFQLIKNPKWGWAADPFLVEKNGDLYIFAELFSYKTEKGVIGCCTYDGKHVSKWNVILEEEYHLSYPNIIIESDEIYMLPETNEDNSICLYKAIEFPTKWKKVEKLYSATRFADTTEVIDGIFVSYNHYTKEYYLLKKNEDRKLELLATYADETRKHRPAGKVFLFDGHLILPTQNETQKYGGGLVLNEIRSVGENGMNSVIIKEIGPEDIKVKFLGISKPDGLHTYNFTENYETIDIRWNRIVLADLLQRAIRKLKK